MKLSDIAATLTDGRFYTGKWLNFLYFSCGVGFLMPIITCGMLLCAGLGVMDWTIYMTLVAAFGNILFFALISICFFLIIKNNKLKRRIYLYLEDAVQLSAYSKSIDALYGRLRFYNGVKIKISFIFQGKNYIKISGNPNKDNFENGYDRVFIKYCDKKIDILYSPRYDEVMILKA